MRAGASSSSELEARPKISIVVPTLNEAPNIPELLKRLKKALEELSVSYEIVFVDDGSTDGTVDVVRSAAEAEGIADKVRVIVRRERGLSTAVLDGVKASRGDYVIVMDADLQHPPEVVPAVYEKLAGGCDVVVAARSWRSRLRGLNPIRLATSLAAEALAKLLLPEARLVSDPLSGFFGFKRSVVEKKVAYMKPKGYKVLLEVLVKGDYDASRVGEVRYDFDKRKAGRSKLSALEVLQFLEHVLELNEYRVLKLAAVGASGVLVNELALWALHYALKLPLHASGALAIELSVVNNCALNDIFTFRDRRRGSSFAARLGKYHLAVAAGLATNYAVLLLLSYALGVEPLVSNLVGIASGFVANYFFSEHYVWKKTPGGPGFLSATS